MSDDINNLLGHPTAAPWSWVPPHFDPPTDAPAMQPGMPISASMFDAAAQAAQQPAPVDATAPAPMAVQPDPALAVNPFTAAMNAPQDGAPQAAPMQSGGDPTASSLPPYVNSFNSDAPPMAPLSAGTPPPQIGLPPSITGASPAPYVPGPNYGNKPVVDTNGVGGPAQLDPEQNAFSQGSYAYKDDPRLDPDHDRMMRYASYLADHDPRELGQLKETWKLQNDNQIAAARVANSTADLKQATDDHDRYVLSQQYAQSKLQEINDQATQLASRTIDTDRFSNSRSVGQAFAGILAAAAAGFVNPTGKNSYIDAFQHAVTQDIDAQKQDIDNGWKGIEAHRGFVGQLFTQSQNSYQSAETARIATYKILDDKLAQQQVMMDPKGTQFAETGTIRANMNSQMAAGQLALSTELAKQEDLRIKNAQKDREITNKQVDDAAKIKIDNRNAATAEWGKAIEAKRNAQMAKHEDAQDAVATAAQADKAGEKDEEQGIVSDLPVIDPKTKKQVIGPDGMPRFAPQVLKNYDGTTPHASKANAAILQKQNAATVEAVKKIDELKRLVADNGGSANWKHSKANQEIEGTYNQLILMLHGADDIPSFRAGTSEFLSKTVGGKDPNSYTFSGDNVEAGLTNLRHNITSNLNNNVKYLSKYDGPLIEFQDASKPITPEKTQTEKQSAAISNYDGDPDGTGEAIRISRGQLDYGPIPVKVADEFDARVKDASNIGGMNQKESFELLKKKAYEKGPAAHAARVALDQVRTNLGYDPDNPDDPGRPGATTPDAPTVVEGNAPQVTK